MIFWVLLVVAVITIAATYIYNAMDDDWAWAFLPALLTAIISLVVGGGLLALALLIPGGKHTDETYGLRAISSSSTVQGSFFLGAGYVDGKRTLNYIAQEDGWSRIDRGIASASRIYEDAEKPTVIEYTHWYSNGWVIPWEFKTGYSWDFHVPAESILEDFTIANE